MFFYILLAVTFLYSVCFTEPIVNYWIGLDKYGGTTLLILLVVAKVFAQIRTYLNSILYTGGMINKSAKYDILWMVLYLLILVGIIERTQIFAVPIATLISCFVFIWIYLSLAKKYLKLNTSMIVSLFCKIFVVCIPFIVLHFLVSPDYHDLSLYFMYFICFTLFYLLTMYCFNKKFFKMLLLKINKKK